MNIIKDFSKLQDFCSQRWENNPEGYPGYHCHNKMTECNEHVCPLLEHRCPNCNNRSKAMKEYWQRRKENERLPPTNKIKEGQIICHSCGLTLEPAEAKQINCPYCGEQI